MSKAAFEQHLVSMVQSLIHLRSIGDELRKKAFVIPRMQVAMAGAARAFQDLTESFGHTEAALQQDAQPYLIQWLASVGLQLGADVRFEGNNIRGAARVRGRLDELQLHPRLINAQRCVTLVLAEPTFAMGGGAYAAYETFTDAQLSPVVDGLRCFRRDVLDSDGVERHVVRVTVPLRRADFDTLMRSSFGIHLV